SPTISPTSPPSWRARMVQSRLSSVTSHLPPEETFSIHTPSSSTRQRMSIASPPLRLESEARDAHVSRSATLHGTGVALTMRERFAISIPQLVADGAFDPAAFRHFLARAEALGFESAWTGEQVLGSTPHLDSMDVLTYAAGCTERLRLGCAVFVTPLHSPVHLAKSVSTLDQLSRGRLEVGVGTGGRVRMFSAFGGDPASLVARFNEGLAVMKALWSEPSVTFKGRFWHFE